MAIPKTEGRDEFFEKITAVIEAAEEQGKEIPRNWTAEAAGMMKAATGKAVDREQLRRAKGKRHVYPDALPALRLFLGLTTTDEVRRLYAKGEPSLLKVILATPEQVHARK